MQNEILKFPYNLIPIGAYIFENLTTIEFKTDWFNET